MRSEFETLEQYQNSVKEFNESTRKSYEEFIQLHGSDREKLQLRFTPYTDKKGGYGSFDLDFGLKVWQHQQSKIDELQKRVDELEAAKRDYVCDCGYLDSLDYEECDCRRHSEDLANEVIAEIVKKANFAGLEELLDELKSRAIKHGVLLNKQALRGEA